MNCPSKPAYALSALAFAATLVQAADSFATEPTPNPASAPDSASAPGPSFYYNTLGQPWQTIPRGLLDWENTVGVGGLRTSPGSVSSTSALALTSLVTGLSSWADVAAVVGGNVVDGKFGEAGGFLGGTSHLAWDLGSDIGLAMYAAPSWGFDKTGITSTSVTLTAVAGHEPSEGWSRDANLAVNYTDQGSFSAVTSPDLNNLWTWSVLGTMGHGAAPNSSYSMETFGAICNGEIANEAGGEATMASAWRLGGGIGYQHNFGKNPTGLAGWALYGGVQWEWADDGAGGTTSSPSLAVNLSLGSIQLR